MVVSFLKYIGSYSASFIFSAFTKNTWYAIIASLVATALVALIAVSFFLNAAIALPNILISAGILAAINVPLAFGMYYFDKQRKASATNTTETVENVQAPDPDSDESPPTPSTSGATP